MPPIHSLEEFPELRVAVALKAPRRQRFPKGSIRKSGQVTKPTSPATSTLPTLLTGKCSQSLNAKKELERKPCKTDEVFSKEMSEQHPEPKFKGITFDPKDGHPCLADSTGGDFEVYHFFGFWGVD
ncbi:unnamed protein product [Symbiodinium sp. CCMP2456]|nr:unnamed protein product [Symbiodinium sp. CCMP2456]